MGERRQKRALDVPIWATTEIRGDLDRTLMRNIATVIETGEDPDFTF